MSSEHMDHMLGSRLVLGGHSFIPELGNDAAIDFDTQLAIVDECLDRGINTFDTTYEPERIALGQLLETLGRRDEAHIIAWNFFTGIRADDYLVAPQPYTASHLDLLLHQLRTDFIDLLVVHPVGDAAADQTQTEIAGAWLACGTVGALGTWNPGSDAAMIFGADNPYEFAVLPRNVENSNTSKFSACRALGWQTFATSPFGRGWLLDRLVQVEEARTSASPASTRARVADAMFRFSIHDPHVDHLVVGIRRAEWIDRNVESVERGPLSTAQEQWLMGLLEQVTAGQG